MEHEQLKQGNYYHIYNRGNNGCRLFRLAEEYEHFLSLYDKYISPIADTLAWTLLGNHFHFVVYIKKEVVYKYSLSKPIANKEVNAVGWEKWFEEHKWETIDLPHVDADRSKDAVRSGEAAADFSAFGEPDNVNDAKMKTPVPHRHFAHLFNAYSRYLQVTTGRTGNLFERPFKRKIIHSKEYLKQAILYVHNNPVHHGFCEHPLEYPWSSYLSCLSEKPTRLKRDDTINLFGNKSDFESQHKHKMDIPRLEKWLGIEPHFDFDRPEEGDVDIDADRSGKAAADLSACATPDNVKMNEDRARPDLSGSGEAAVDLSAFGEPDNVKGRKDNVKKIELKKGKCNA